MRSSAKPALGMVGVSLRTRSTMRATVSPNRGAMLMAARPHRPEIRFATGPRAAASTHRTTAADSSSGQGAGMWASSVSSRRSGSGPGSAAHTAMARRTTSSGASAPCSSSTRWRSRASGRPCNRSMSTAAQAWSPRAMAARASPR
jgi:hypothetical protein